MLSINTIGMCHFIAHIHMILIPIFIETVDLLMCSFFSLIAEKLYFIFKTGWKQTCTIFSSGIPKVLFQLVFSCAVKLQFDPWI